MGSFLCDYSQLGNLGCARIHTKKSSHVIFFVVLFVVCSTNRRIDIDSGCEQIEEKKNLHKVQSNAWNVLKQFVKRGKEKRETEGKRTKNKTMLVCELNEYALWQLIMSYCLQFSISKFSCVRKSTYWVSCDVKTDYPQSRYRRYFMIFALFYRNKDNQLQR